MRCALRSFKSISAALAVLAVPLLLGGVPSASAQSVSVFEPIVGVDVIYATGGQAFFYLTTARTTGVPPCATDAKRWVFMGSTAAGQATLAAVLSAYATGKLVQVHGTGACDVWGDTETVNYVSVR